MTIRELYLFRDAGDHIAFRDVSVYIVDNRDKRGLDGKPLYHPDGNPRFEGEEPPWVAPGHFLSQPVIERLPDEIAFDHMPGDQELSEAFGNYQKYKRFEIWRKQKQQAAKEAAAKAIEDAHHGEMREFEAQQVAVADILQKSKG
jgi:hypothetical protein